MSFSVCNPGKDMLAERDGYLNGHTLSSKEVPPKQTVIKRPPV